MPNRFVGTRLVPQPVARNAELLCCLRVQRTRPFLGLHDVAVGRVEVLPGYRSRVTDGSVHDGGQVIARPVQQSVSVALCPAPDSSPAPDASAQ